MEERTVIMIEINLSAVTRVSKHGKGRRKGKLRTTKAKVVGVTVESVLIVS